MSKQPNSNITVKKERKFNGQVYELASNKHGTNSDEAKIIKQSFLKRGYRVRTVWNGNYPYIYPEGRFFVYIRRPSSPTVIVPIYE